MNDWWGKQGCHHQNCVSGCVSLGLYSDSRTQDMGGHFYMYFLREEGYNIKVREREKEIKCFLFFIYFKKMIKVLAVLLSLLGWLLTVLLSLAGWLL
jgi:hypothetical protein